MKKVINLHKQDFGGHKEALELEVEIPVKIKTAVELKMKSLNTFSERLRNEKMVRRLLPTNEVPDYDINPGDQMFYVMKEKTKIFFRLDAKDLNGD
jgi:hypothetical protein